MNNQDHNLGAQADTAGRRQNCSCAIHTKGKYLHWPCGSKYDKNRRRERFLKSKIPCPMCGERMSPTSKTCKKCTFKNRTHWLKGKRLPDWWKERITNKFEPGEKHWNWKGGTTPKNKLVRQSYKFKTWRQQIFERDNFTCQVCGKRGGELHPDHILPFSLFPEHRFELDNGRTLCRECHIKTPTWGHAANNMTRAQFLQK